MGYTTIIVEVPTSNAALIEKIQALLDQLGSSCACKCTTLRFYKTDAETHQLVQCVKFVVMSAWGQKQINQTLTIIETAAYYEANQKRN